LLACPKPSENSMCIIDGLPTNWRGRSPQRCKFRPKGCAKCCSTSPEAIDTRLHLSRLLVPAPGRNDRHAL
jgi:hypothetical protein